MTTHRLLPPATRPGNPQVGGAVTTIVNGRTYTATPGAALDVPDFDSQALVAAGWLFIAESGPTSARPSIASGITNQYPLAPGLNPRFYDTTVSFLIFWDGVTWRDAAGTSH